MTQHATLFLNKTIKDALDSLLIDVVETESPTEMLHNDDREIYYMVVDLYQKGKVREARDIVINFYTAVLRLNIGML